MGTIAPAERIAKLERLLVGLLVGLLDGIDAVAA